MNSQESFNVESHNVLKPNLTVRFEADSYICFTAHNPRASKQSVLSTSKRTFESSLKQTLTKVSKKTYATASKPTPTNVSKKTHTIVRAPS